MTNEQMFEQILNELKGLNNRVGNIENELQGFKTLVNSRFDTLETKISLTEMKIDNIQQDITEIKATTGRIEENEPANILTMLKQVNKTLDDRDNDIQALNKRVFKTESEIERLTRL